MARKKVSGVTMKVEQVFAIDNRKVERVGYIGEYQVFRPVKDVEDELILYVVNDDMSVINIITVEADCAHDSGYIVDWSIQ